MSETAYYNGRVYTSDKDSPVAQAFIVCDGRFREVGDNSKAMEALGIDENTKDPGEHSYFARNRSGIPTGLVIEIPAMMQCKKLLANKKSDPSAILKMLSKQYACYGYTTIFEAMSSDSEDYGLKY